MGRQDFWLAAIVGSMVMLLLAFLPVLGPLVGGFVAGLIARGNIKNGAKAGFVAGIIGALLAALVLLLPASIPGGIFHHALAGFLTGAGLGIILIAAGLYQALLGLAGGAVGAALVKG